MRNLNSESSLDTGIFYETTAIWHHGLFYFKAGADEQSADLTTVSYLAWMEHANSLILLVGSPDHVLGNRVAREGIFVPGTSAAIEEITTLTKFMPSDESCCLSHDLRDGGSDKSIEVAGTSKLAFGDYDRCGSLAFPSVGSPPSAVSLAMLCFYYLSTLPVSRLDTMFRLFSKYTSIKQNIYADLKKSVYGDLATRASFKDDPARSEFSQTGRMRKTIPDSKQLASTKWKKVSSEVSRFHLRNYNTVWVGSPVYTALV